MSDAAALHRRAPFKDRRHNILLMGAVPLLLAMIGSYFWLTGGRYVSTENAYIKQYKVGIGADVEGRIVEVLVGEDQHVEAGTPLFRLDPRPYDIALRESEAALASARIAVQQLHAEYLESVADLHGAEADLDYQQREFDRQSALVKKGVASQAKLDDVRNALQGAQDEVAKHRQTVTSALAALGIDVNAPIERHPLVQGAIARRDKAALDLSHVTVTAPAAGIVSRSALLQVGMYVVTGAPVMSLVKDTPVWVEANFKETDLTHMKVGQRVTIHVDAFPSVKLTATVWSISAGTGSEFSLLPAQNASGNWVKVVQRVPVRLKLESVPDGRILKSGMSVRARVDMRSPAGEATPQGEGAPVALRVGQLP